MKSKEKLTKFQKLFWFTYRFRNKEKETISGILFLIDLITIPINLPILLSSKWERRLI